MKMKKNEQGKGKRNGRPSEQCSNSLIEERENLQSQRCFELPGPFIPSDNQQQCRRMATGWRCRAMAAPRKRYCEKHEMSKNVRNQKRRKRPVEESRVMMEPRCPSDPPQQCRRLGKGWRCRTMSLSGKWYCDKHQSQMDVRNEKRRRKGKLVEETCPASEMDIDGRPNQGDEENMGPENVSQTENAVFQTENSVQYIVNTQCEVRRSGPRRDRYRGEHHLKQDIHTAKRRNAQQEKDVASKNSLFPVNEGVVDEQHPDKTLGIAQIDSAQLLSPILEEHQTRSSIMEDNDDNQHIPVDPITTTESTVEVIEQPQSLNEVDDSLNFDIACSSPLPQQEEAHAFLLESGSCNLPDERSKTAAKEFVDEKRQFDKILARLNMRLEAFIEMKE